MLTPQELKFIWLNMATQLGTFDGKDDWTVYIKDDENLLKVTVHIGWHTITFEVFEVDDEQNLKENMSWKVSTEKDIPEELIVFLKETLNNGKWFKKIPENWGVNNPFI